MKMVSELEINRWSETLQHSVTLNYKNNYDVACLKLPSQVVTNLLVGLSLLNVEEILFCSCGGAVESAVDEPTTEEGNSSDISVDGPFIDDSLEKRIELGLEQLCSTARRRVLAGFSHLTKCALLPGGPRAVFNAQYLPKSSSPDESEAMKVIPTAIKLARTQDPQYTKRAVSTILNACL